MLTTKFPSDTYIISTPVKVGTPSNDNKTKQDNSDISDSTHNVHNKQSLWFVLAFIHIIKNNIYNVSCTYCHTTWID